MSKELITHFAEEISHLHGNPNCKSCYGRFWAGISELPNGNKFLVLCHCVKNLGPTEYARLQRYIDQRVEALAKLQGQAVQDLEEVIRRQSWLYRLRKWWKK